MPKKNRERSSWRTSSLLLALLRPPATAREWRARSPSRSFIHSFIHVRGDMSDPWSDPGVDPPEVSSFSSLCFLEEAFPSPHYGGQSLEKWQLGFHLLTSPHLKNSEVKTPETLTEPTSSCPGQVLSAIQQRRAVLREHSNATSAAPRGGDLVFAELRRDIPGQDCYGQQSVSGAPVTMSQCPT